MVKINIFLLMQNFIELYELLMSCYTVLYGEPGGPCTKSMEVSESRMQRVNSSLRNASIFKKINKTKMFGVSPNTLS